MKFVKDKSSIKYWILAGICIICIYSSQISNLFEPIFDNIYYGNLVKLFTSVLSALIWFVEFIIIFFVCKKLNINLFGGERKTYNKKVKKNKIKNKNLSETNNSLTTKNVNSVENCENNLISASKYDFSVEKRTNEDKNKYNNHAGTQYGELPIWRVCLLFVACLLPMLVISAYLNFQIKLVYSLGIRVTSVGLVCNVSEILSYLFRILYMMLIIRCVQQAMEINFKFNKKVAIPWGGIFLFLTVGLIDFLVFPVDLNVFYLINTLWYGVIYLLADKKFSVAYILSYLIWLL